jgi:protease-4
MVIPSTHETIRKQLELHLGGKYAMPDMPDDPEDEEDDGVEIDPEELTQPESKITIIVVDGIIGKHLGMLEVECGGCDLDTVSEQLDEAADDANIETIIMYFNTPGGTVCGVPELAAKIDEVTKKKKCIAYTDVLCASAGYYLASQCTAVFASPSSTIGSIGVYSIYLDETRAIEDAGIKVNAISAGKYKLTGASFKPMTDEERAMIQSDVDKIYNEFKLAVTSKREVVDDDMQGQVFDGVTAVSKNLVDGTVTSLKELVTFLQEQ